MSKRGMRLLPLSIATMALAALGACATVGQRKTAEPPSDVSCALFAAISYAQMKPGQVDDAGNVADSDATVREIEAHNAKFDTVCGDPLKAPR